MPGGVVMIYGKAIELTFLPNRLRLAAGGTDAALRLEHYLVFGDGHAVGVPKVRAAAVFFWSFVIVLLEVALLAHSATLVLSLRVPASDKCPGFRVTPPSFSHVARGTESMATVSLIRMTASNDRLRLDGLVFGEETILHGTFSCHRGRRSWAGTLTTPRPTFSVLSPRPLCVKVGRRH